jgi:hypothetical protein
MGEMQKRAEGLTEALDDALPVIIGPARGLAPLEETLEHDRLGGCEEEDEGGLAHLLQHFSGKVLTRAGEEYEECGVTHSLVELDCLIQLARETVNEEATLAVLPGRGER